jgi:predicted secreted protein
MNWFTAVVTYLTMWWIVLFCVLPFGVRSQAEMGEVTEGTDPGAPVIPNMKKKLLWTTIITFVVWGSLAFVISMGWVSLSNPLGIFERG